MANISIINECLMTVYVSIIRKLGFIVSQCCVLYFVLFVLFFIFFLHLMFNLYFNFIRSFIICSASSSFGQAWYWWESYSFHKSVVMKMLRINYLKEISGKSEACLELSFVYLSFVVDVILASCTPPPAYITILLARGEGCLIEVLIFLRA